MSKHLSRKAFWESLPRTLPLGYGRSVTLRPIRREDLDLEIAFAQGLSVQTRYNRLLGAGATISREWLERLVDVDQKDHVALIATVMLDDDLETQIGVARFVRNPDGGSAEFAVTVADAWQGHGIGHSLLELLVEGARAAGLRELIGDVLPSNTGMLGLARSMGFAVTHRREDAHLARVVKTLKRRRRIAIPVGALA